MPHFPPNAYFCTMQPSEELKNHIETEIIPRYESFDAAHGTDHVRTVIAQSLDLARHYDVDADMIYAVAAYHDTGLARGRELHHIHSGEILLADTELRRWFTAEQLAVMRDAVEDHRASSDHAPRTIYGRIVAEADRCIDPATVLRRTVQYGHVPLPRTRPRGTLRTLSCDTCGKSTPKAVTSGSGFPNRTTPANRRNCGR